jgi:hypothetical protein
LNDPPIECPGFGCLQPKCCQQNADCQDSSQYCRAPAECPEEGNCTTNCASQSDCPKGTVCDPLSLSCNCGGCVAPCQKDADCKEGAVCEKLNGGSQCSPKACGGDTDCPPNFKCVALPGPGSRCLRLDCTTDAQCPDGSCVDGQCYSSLGMCQVYPI